MLPFLTVSLTCWYAYAVKFFPLFHAQEAIPAGADLCGDVFVESTSATVSGLMDGDETAAILKRDPGELMVRPL